MKKMPIELLTSRTASALNGCPVIWDGNNVVLATAAELNVVTIARSLGTLTRAANEANSRSEANSLELSRLNPSVQSLNLLIPQIAQRMNAVEQVMTSESGVTVRLAQVEERVNSLEQDINNILQGGSSGGGGGGSISSTWSAILTALSAGNYIAGDNGITVEKVTTGTAAGQYRIKLTSQPVQVSLTSTSDLVKVTAREGGVIAVGIDATKFTNYISAGAGLKTDNRDAERVVIKPDRSLVVGDSTTIKVTFNELSGQFKIEAIAQTSSGGGGAVTLDNKTVIRDSSGAVSVAPNFLRTAAGQLTYTSNNFSEMLVVAASNRFTGMADAEFLQRLGTKGIASKAAAIANPNFSSALKSLVFNSANSPILDGKNYLLKDFNSAQALVEFATNGVVIDPAAELKNFKFAVKADLRFENMAFPALRFGSTFPLLVQNLMIPFVIYSLENLTSGRVCRVGGDILRYATISGDGNGGELSISDSKTFDNSELAAQNLTPGLYKLTAFIGIRVATTADSTFNSIFVGKFAVEPRINAEIAFH